MYSEIRYILFTLILAFMPQYVFTQDLSKEFTQDEMLWFVKKFHPISKQGQILLQEGEENIKLSKGSLDPYIYGNIDQKYYSDKNYYSIIGSGLKVPTWYGVEFKGGYDVNTGDKLNPQNTTPTEGLWYAGVSVPLGKGLFIDKRRAAIKQSELLADTNIEEQKLILNELFHDAIKQYWHWVAAYNQYKVYEESISLAEQRFDAVKNSYQLGIQPAIDTLEAMIQLQNRKMSLNDFSLKYKNASLKLSNYLWFENNTPLELSDSLIPPTLNIDELNIHMPVDSLNNLISQVDENHPELIMYKYKLSGLEIKRKLKSELIKPKLNLNYNILSNNNYNNTFPENFSFNNYKWGLEFGMPIFLRKERGELKLAKLKIQDAEYSIQQKKLELSNKIKKSYNEQNNLHDQILLYESAVNNYSLLLNGENEKFNQGESSLFLINSRETKLLNAKIKLIELNAKLKMSNAEILYVSGLLYKL